MGPHCPLRPLSTLVFVYLIDAEADIPLIFQLTVSRRKAARTTLYSVTHCNFSKAIRLKEDDFLSRISSETQFIYRSHF